MFWKKLIKWRTLDLDQQLLSICLYPVCLFVSVCLYHQAILIRIALDFVLG